MVLLFHLDMQPWFELNIFKTSKMPQTFRFLLFWPEIERENDNKYLCDEMHCEKFVCRM